MSISFSQEIDLKALELGKRGNDYRVWIYFKDKAGSEKINATQEAYQRRLKHGSTSLSINSLILISLSYFE